MPRAVMAEHCPTKVENQQTIVLIKVKIAQAFLSTFPKIYSFDGLRILSRQMILLFW